MKSNALKVGWDRIGWHLVFRNWTAKSHNVSFVGTEHFKIIVHIYRRKGNGADWEVKFVTKHFCCGYSNFILDWRAEFLKLEIVHFMVILQTDLCRAPLCTFYPYCGFVFVDHVFYVLSFPFILADYEYFSSWIQDTPCMSGHQSSMSII